MTLKDIGKKVAGAAPLVGAALAGPAGTAVGQLVAHLFGCENTPEAIDAAIAADPNALLKLRELELSHKVEIEKLVLEAERIRLGDVQNARQRELGIVQATGKLDLNLYVLAWLVVGGFFGLMGLLIFTTLPPVNIGPVNQLFGALSAGFGMVLQYFFGSSKSSSEKTKLLAGKDA